MPRLLKFSREATDGKPTRRSPLSLAVLEFESPSAAIIASPVPALGRAINLLVFRWSSRCSSPVR
jgi:hemolysin D